MKTQLVPNSFRGALARDSLKTTSHQMFTVLYDLILYVMVPIAFEMSYVKIFLRSMNAYEVNDFEAMSRLIVYLVIQWLLGVMVRRDYLKVTLKRITLTLLILLQLKEAFFEEVLIDMVISMIMESGSMVLLFFKFSHMVVVLKMAGLSWMIAATLLCAVANRSYFIEQLNSILEFANKFRQMFMFRICNCMIQHTWSRQYC